ncbi:TetR family transcriptional regulator [Ensifer sp. LC13]|nr:TetR family transcriptional regulator [Ensifer sp. LC14]OCP03317.1 TetR family transcriptional regulator [Ensifer sp. LC11]OCP03685.1 TetR family transcriptional regulator [Ensifer sp. LC13]OCP34098.1 TetR family transcriptional regulator [Ensifer sp. LC499]
MKNSNSAESSARRRGRPRAFDRDVALAAAGETFWRLGYEGASIADLTAAMGITPQSLYAAFTSKADLYREALEQYRQEEGAAAGRSLASEGHVVEVIGKMLRASAHEFTLPGRPKGCMISTAVLTCAVENQAIAKHVSALRGETLALLEHRLRQGVVDGELGAETDAAGLARFVGAILQGMTVQAQDGASETELLQIAELAIGEVARHRQPSS